MTRTGPGAGLPRHRLAWLAATALAVLLLPAVLGSYAAFQLTLVAALALPLVGLQLLTGRAGLISLGQGAFWAVGSYVAAIALQRGGWSAPAAVAAAGLTGAALGALLALPALRLPGPQLALATFALAMALPQALKHPALARWTGGTQGVLIERPAACTLLGRTLDGDRVLAACALVVLALAMALAHHLRRARFGRALAALRDEPLVAQVLGHPRQRLHVQVFALAAALAGLGGALSALAVGFVAPDGHGAMFSITLLTGLLIGGLNTTAGVLAGALFIHALPLAGMAFGPSAPAAVQGLVLIAAMIAFPHGLGDAAHHAWRRWRSRGVPNV